MDLERPPHAYRSSKRRPFAAPVHLPQAHIERGGSCYVIYSTFDDMKKRTVGDTIRAHGNPVPAMHASSAGAAIRTIMCDFFQRGHASRALITKEDVVDVHDE